MVPDYMKAGKPSESELVIPLVNGCEIQVMGMDVPERVEGRSLWHILLDEYGNMHADAWSENIRPALGDLEGSADLIGVPEGRNHYYNLFESALALSAAGDLDWRVFKWSARSVLSAKEIDAIVRDLDELTARQEIDADFVDYAGATYYSFSQANVIPVFGYDAAMTLDLCFDFNVAPGVAALIQKARNKKTGDEVDVIFDEVHIPAGSNTPRVCREITRKYADHRGKVRVFADATGGAKKTSSTEGSDLELLEKYLRPTFGERLSMHVPKSNPSERARVNAVNSRLCSMNETRRLFVAAKCRHTIADFGGVRNKPDGSIDKERDEKLSHLSDAIGYRIHKLYPITDHFSLAKSA